MQVTAVSSGPVVPSPQDQSSSPPRTASILCCWRGDGFGVGDGCWSVLLLLVRNSSSHAALQRLRSRDARSGAQWW
ncbi:unnamed protein product [Merluccius merluccius]